MSQQNISELVGKTALITGASGNLGIQIVKIFIDMGANIVAQYHTDQNKNNLETILNEVNSTSQQCICIKADISNEAEVINMFEQAINAFNNIDIVVNTAGIMLKKNLQETSLEEYQSIFNVHATGAFLILKNAAKHIEDNGRIINISTSLTRISGAPQYSVYSAAKAATEQLTKYLATEIGHRGVTVNTVSPGPLNNEFLRSQENEQSLTYLSNMSPFSRLGNASDITPIIELLSSEKSRWITGQNIRVNGGIT